MELNRERLAKLLALTQRDNENEIVGAVRKCNEMLAAAGTTWDKVLATQEAPQVTVTVTRHGFGGGPEQDMGVIPAHLRDKVLIGIMFRAIYAQPRSDNEEFWQGMDAAHNTFQQFGWLTPRQFAYVRGAYQRVSTAGL